MKKLITLTTGLVAATAIGSTLIGFNSTAKADDCFSSQMSVESGRLVTYISGNVHPEAAYAGYSTSGDQVSLYVSSTGGGQARLVAHELPDRVTATELDNRWEICLVYSP